MTVSSSRRQSPQAWLTACIGWILILFAPSHVEGQSSLQWITESTITFGHPGTPDDRPWARTLYLADLGLRWAIAPRWSVGFSLSGGLDMVANDAGGLGGARVRLTREWERSRLEGSAGLYVYGHHRVEPASILGVAYYPLPWVAAVAQVDLLSPPGGYTTPEGHVRPHTGWSSLPYSVGLRLAEPPGLTSLGFAAAGVLAAAILALTWQG